MKSKENSKPKRTLARETVGCVGEEITVMGYVYVRRDHGKLIFIDMRDRSGLLQIVFNPQVSSEAHQLASELHSEDVVRIIGTVNSRPEKLINSKIVSGTVELEATSLEIVVRAEPLPFDIGKEELDVTVPIQLDHRALSLRHPKVQAVFRVQAVIIDAFREYMRSQDFLEFQTPCITPAVAEGGSEVFQIGYFDHKAFLSQSPQLYKQIAMSAFERVFSVNKIFRAEPSATTRHLTEVVSLDAEMAFIESWIDVRDMCQGVVTYILGRVSRECASELALHGVSVPHILEKTPTYSLTEAQEMIFAFNGRDVRGETDLSPEDERNICEVVKNQTGSDFVFVYGFPTRQKPFYVYPNPDNPEFNEGLDLLCRGLEWLSGGRRINELDQLKRHIKEWGLEEEKVKIFLDAFRYGVPPEGGFAFGAERMTMQILGLKNIREASMFPRDMERIDLSLSKSD